MGRLLAGPIAAFVAAIGLFLAVPAAAAAPTFPTLSGRVVDQANILSPQVESDLTLKLGNLEAQSGRQLVVVTVASLQGQEIEDYGYQLGRSWGIGSKERNDGALFLIAPTEHKTRIEVGYGLEPILTDALSSVILQTKVLPRFKAGDMEGGVVDGTDALIGQLSLPADEAQAVAAKAVQQTHHRGGAGLLPFIIIFIIFLVLTRGRGFLPWILLSALTNSGRGSGWGDSGGGGWGGGGGGFSGGGGSFGGGGSSGSW